MKGGRNRWVLDVQGGPQVHTPGSLGSKIRVKTPETKLWASLNYSISASRQGLWETDMGNQSQKWAWWWVRSSVMWRTFRIPSETQSDHSKASHRWRQADHLMGVEKWREEAFLANCVSATQLIIQLYMETNLYLKPANWIPLSDSFRHNRKRRKNKHQKD